MSSSQGSGSPRERILRTAAELFYKNGYRATGINEVIDKSGVAKATFYSHFPSKDDLCQAYLEERNRGELALLEQTVAQKTTPRDKLLAVIETLGPWLEENRLRGCGFLNMVAEEPDPDSPLRQVGKAHYQHTRQLVRGLSEALFAAEPEKYREQDVATFTDEFMVIFTGTIGLVEIYHETWPIEQGIRAVHRLLDQ